MTQLNYNWSIATTSYFKALKNWVSCSQAGHKCWIEMIDNTTLKAKGGYPIFSSESKTLTYNNKIPVKAMVYVIAWTDGTPQLNYLQNFFISLSRLIKYIPNKSYTLNMRNYKVFCYRVGSVENGFSVEIRLPKKFSFK